MPQPRWKSAVSDFRIHQSQFLFLRQLDKPSIPTLSEGVGLASEALPLLPAFLRPRLQVPPASKEGETTDPTKHAGLPTPTRRDLLFVGQNKS